MKFKTTRNQINQNYNSVISIGYCEAQYLLQGKNPIAYNAGYYGWNCDIYDINGVAIVTGYRPWGNIHPDYNIIKNMMMKPVKYVTVPGKTTKIC